MFSTDLVLKGVRETYLSLVVRAGGSEKDLDHFLVKAPRESHQVTSQIELEKQTDAAGAWPLLLLLPTLDSHILAVFLRNWRSAVLFPILQSHCS